MWLQLRDLPDCQTGPDCFILHGDAIIDDAMKYYFPRDHDDKLSLRQKCTKNFKELNPDFEMDYINVKLQEITSDTSKSGLIVVHSVKSKNVAESLISRGFVLFRLNTPMEDRIKIALHQNPQVDSEDLQEFIETYAANVSGEFEELNHGKSHASIVTQILNVILL